MLKVEPIGLNAPQGLTPKPIWAKEQYAEVEECFPTSTERVFREVRAEEY